MKILELEGDVQFRQIAYDPEVGRFLNGARGNRIGYRWPSLSLRSRKGTVKKGIGLGDCPYFAPEILIVSERLKRCIQQFADSDVEFLPLLIDGEAGYSYMNVLRVIDALDVDNSELRRFDDGAIMYVVKAQYHETLVDGHDIFLLPNYRGVYVTEQLRQYIEESNVVGATFRDTSARVENPLEEVFAARRKKGSKSGRH